MSELTIIPDGKYLLDLTYEVDVLRKAITLSGDNEGCICWQKNGLLAYFDSEHGRPACYWSETTEGSREGFTSLSELIQYMVKIDTSKDRKPQNKGYYYLLTQPVWKVMEAKSEVTREAFNKLLGDIEIDL